MRKYLLLAVLFISFGNLIAQSNTVMIKSVEPKEAGHGLKKNLFIVDENGQVETIKLEKHNNKGITQNMIVLKKAIDRYLQKGYTIISSTSTVGNGGIVVVHTYLLERID